MDVITAEGLVKTYLPMARPTVLIGRSVSDLVDHAGILIVLMLPGLAVGWPIRTGVPELLAAVWGRRYGLMSR